MNSERFLLARGSLATAAVPPGPLDDEMQAWATNFNAFLVAPISEMLTDADRAAAIQEVQRQAQQAWMTEAIEQARKEGIALGEERASRRGSYQSKLAPKAPAKKKPADAEQIAALKAEIRQLKANHAALNTEAIAFERDNLKLKIEVLQDVASQCGGENGDKWNHQKLEELADILREIL